MSDMSDKTKAELLEELSRLCRQYDPQLPTRIVWDNIQAVRTELLNRSLSNEEMGRLVAMDSEYNLYC